MLGEGFDDLQLRTDDKRVHLLRRDGERFREVTSETDWPTYNGDPGGNRYTTLTQIDKANVARLAPQWMFTMPERGAAAGARRWSSAASCTSPRPNECYALDAGSGPADLALPAAADDRASPAAAPIAASAVAGDRVFMETDNAHLIALNRFTGELLWDTELADWRQNYSASSAPLPAGNLVDLRRRRRRARRATASSPRTIRRPARKSGASGRCRSPASPDRRPGRARTSSTAARRPGSPAATIPSSTSSTGRPAIRAKEYNGDDRKGDNLYSDCILALDRKTGKLKWHYQFTPHDLWDWDATQTSVLVDADWQGQPRKLMLHANRNGFFYVFDRARRQAAAGQAVRAAT